MEKHRKPKRVCAFRLEPETYWKLEDIKKAWGCKTLTETITKLIDEAAGRSKPWVVNARTLSTATPLSPLVDEPEIDTEMDWGA
jgi:hypothetical protein